MPSSVGAQRDYYVVLGIDPTVGTSEVNAAFRRLAWRCHPDRNAAPDATSLFQSINEARQALADPVRRAAYDASRTPRPQAHRRTSHAPLHPHSHCNWHRRHRVRPAVVTLVAFVLTISACASLFSAASYRHARTSAYGLETSLLSQEEPWQQSRFSLEMYPVCQLYDPCLRSMEWEINLRNSGDGSTRALTAPGFQAQAPR